MQRLNTRDSLEAMTKTTNISQSIETFDDYCAFIATMHLPRYAELPHIDLYMDQLLTYLELHLRPLCQADEKLITASMINNYVKQGIVPTPQAKRYGPNHVAYLIAICILKRSFSMQHIHQMLDIQVQTHDLSSAYDFLCTTFELALQVLFNDEVSEATLGSWGTREIEGYGSILAPESVEYLTPVRRLALSSISCAASKIYVEKCVEYAAWE